MIKGVVFLKESDLQERIKKINEKLKILKAEKTIELQENGLFYFFSVDNDNIKQLIDVEHTKKETLHTILLFENFLKLF